MIMLFDRLRIVAAAIGAVMLLTAPVSSQEPKATPKGQNATPADGKKDAPRRPDRFTEAETLLSGPAAHPECVWHGQRVVSLLSRDDVDTAFRHIDLYDRFGCPGGHIQATFRCLLRQGDPDPKSPEKLEERVHACWINPNLEPGASSASAPGGTTNR